MTAPWLVLLPDYDLPQPVRILEFDRSGFRRVMRPFVEVEDDYWFADGIGVGTSRGSVVMASERDALAIA